MSDAPRADLIDAPATYSFPKTHERLLSWERAEAQLDASRYYWLTTTRPDGRPHATPLWGVWLDGHLYFDGLSSTRWAKNLARNPRACVHLESGDDVVILEGRVEDCVADAALGARIVARWAEKYGRLMPRPSQGIFRFSAESARAWSTEKLQDGTRWHFQ